MSTTNQEGQTLVEIAEDIYQLATDQMVNNQLKKAKKVQLIYAFNGTGKTRLSRTFKEVVCPNQEGEEDEAPPLKVLYYNAFTEDLFYWDNDLDNDRERKLKIQDNGFTSWLLREEGKGKYIVDKFQRYANKALSPQFNATYSEVSFSIKSGDDQATDNIKISKGEESNFIWSIFSSLLTSIIDDIEEQEKEEEIAPSSSKPHNFNELEYIFIDDPVSSLDDSHLIELAVDLAQLIKSSPEKLKFIITTHNPLFYNVLSNEFKPKKLVKRRLEKFADGSYQLSTQPNDSPFSYHLFLLAELDKAIAAGGIQRYHFNFLRNIFEKLSTFLGYTSWQDLLPGDTDEDKSAYYNRLLNIFSHSKHSGEEIAPLKEQEKAVLKFLVEHIRKEYKFK